MGNGSECLPPQWRGLRRGRSLAQPGFPSKPVHIFVPYAAGGGVDILARTRATWCPAMGSNGRVETGRARGGVVASQALVTSPPDVTR